MANRQYNNPYPSVTQVLGILRKIGLENWFKYNTAKFCDEKSRKGREIGILIHQAIHDYITTQEAKIETIYVEEVSNALKGFIAFTKEQPDYKFINSEIMLTSERYKFNGTTDCLVEKDGILWIADWKSSEAKKKEKPDIYDEYLYQVAAYVYLYNEVKNTVAVSNSITGDTFYLEEVDVDKKIQPIENAFILSLAKDKIAYNYRIMGRKEIDDCFNEVFLPALKIYNHQKKEEILWKTN